MNGNWVAIWYISLIVGQNTGLDRPQIEKCFPLSQNTIHSTRITRLSDNKVQNKVSKNPECNFVESLHLSVITKIPILTPFGKKRFRNETHLR